MNCPNCGNSEFYAHQVLHVDCIVNYTGEWCRQLGDKLTDDIYYAGRPFGPFRCTECGHTLEHL